MKSIALLLHEALSRPLKFAQMREDPLMELQLIAENGARSGFFIGSGGCTVAAVAALGGLEHMVVADPNPAQMAMVELKLHLLSFPTKKRAEILGHMPMNHDIRSQVITDLLNRIENQKNVMGDIKEIGIHGPDFFGRFEWLLEKMREAFGESCEFIDAAICGNNINGIENYLKTGISEAFTLPILHTLFGKEFTSNNFQTFTQYFITQILIALERNPQQNNFLKKFLQPHNKNQDLPLWMNAPDSEVGANIERYTMNAQEVLNEFSGDHDIIHLSNILDWMSSEESQKTLTQSYHALNKNGVVIVRQLNSNVDIPSLAPNFFWEVKNGLVLSKEDNSFLYRNIYIGRKI